jgi:ubiquitin carboxyl-terminal hydrolase 31
MQFYTVSSIAFLFQVLCVPFLFYIGTNLSFALFAAYCRNPYDTQWYCFDDTRVDQVADTSLVTAAAYILFYQRRGLGTSYSSAASTSSSGSGGLEHWVCRMPAFTRSSKSQEELNHKGQFA